MINQKLNFENGAWVEACGRSGGIALFRNNEVDMRIRGWAESGQKWRTWDMLRGLNNNPGM